MKIFDRVAKQPHPVPLGCQPVPGPLWVLRRQHVSFRMRHQAENPACRIADTGHIPLGTIWIHRKPTGFTVRIRIAKDDLPGLFQSFQDPFLPANEIPLAVGDRYVHAVVTFQEGALARVDCEMDPAILEAAMRIVGQRGDGAFVIPRNEKPGLENRLKAVADTKNQLVLVAENSQHFAEKMKQLVGEDFPRGYVVAEGEAAGDDQYLELLEKGWMFPKSIYVKTFRRSPGFLEGEFGFAVAVSAWGTQDENAGWGHEGYRSFRRGFPGKSLD